MKYAISVRSLGHVASTAMRVGRLLASVQLAVALLVVLAAVLAWATILEAQRGREVAQWFVYTSPWFVALLGLLGLNLLAATLARWPWRKRRIGFVVTHAGLLVLLGGAIQTFQSGIEGQVVLREGERTDKLLMRHRSLITVDRLTTTGKLSSQFAFNPGAVDWRAGKTLDFGDSQNLGLKVLAFCRHARPDIEWVADERDDQGAVLRLQLSDRTGQTIAEDWLTASAYGGEVLIGPTRYALLPIAVESMLEDFLRPPTDELGTAGVLSMHYGGRMYRARIDEKKGQTVPLGDSGAAVEIVDYYADAKPMPDGRKFVSRSDKPRNPVLELRIQLPGEREPIRQLAFAKAPLLNLDGVFGRVCPVKFWYHHANMPQTPGCVFLQTPAGRLYCRSVVDGSLAEPAEVALDNKIPVGGQFDIAVVKHLPRARREVTFNPVESASDTTNPAEAAALVELSLGQEQRRLWVSRGEGEYAVQSVLTPLGLVAVTFGYQELPLGFTIALQDFVRNFNPGRIGDAAFTSAVKLADPSNSVEESREISMNAPLTHGKFTFYQSGFQELPGGAEASVLTVTCDPGRLLKYAGSLMICAGILISVSMRKFVASALVFLSFSMAGPARAEEESQFDWQAWGYLATQDGGRQKPLDSLAWETLRTLSNRKSLSDPDTGRRLGAVQLYLTLLFDWQGWDQPRTGGAELTGHPASKYFGLHQGDKWDRLPLIRVDYLELRDALGINKHDKYISPYDLSQAKIEVPETHDRRPFLLWAEGLLRRDENELSAYEKRARELADRYASYQHHRMGNRLHVLPARSGQDQPWMSVAELSHAKFDDQTDPSGRLRGAQLLWGSVRTAYRNGSAVEFNRASAAWLAMMREAGLEIGTDAAPSDMRLEVLYNHWVPFRIAWICMMLAFVCLLLNCLLLKTGSSWSVFLVAGWSLFLFGSVAIVVGFAMRIAISGRAPVTNMYESVVYVGLGVAIFGALLEIIHRRRYVLTAAAAVATVALILADNCPVALDPSLQPLQPVLRSNFWLVTHVMTITMSYAAFALALGISNITLGYFLCGAEDGTAIESLTAFTYRAMQVGVLLLAAGTVLGGVWADYSWGRFWGWDPKEVWALITLLGYLAVLHARYAHWVKPFGLAILSTICFSLVVMAWYGVNFVLGAGLHSYGFGAGGAAYVLIAAAVQATYVVLATVRHALYRLAEREHERLYAGTDVARFTSSTATVSPD
jgi:cytochrome c-type biogenesis protein CcsB